MRTKDLEYTVSMIKCDYTHCGKQAAKRFTTTIVADDGYGVEYLTLCRKHAREMIEIARLRPAMVYDSMQSV